MTQLGAIAAGHKKTAAAAELILRDGGNAFDAVVAAFFAACVSEPVLTSLGGGGFLLAEQAGKSPDIYDFSVQTPQRQRHPDEVDFYPISADFGTAQQEFHIGHGAAATPGAVKGIFAIHQALCTIPMSRLIEPAVEMARSGIVVNSFQGYIFQIVQAIFSASSSVQQHYASPGDPARLVQQGDIFRQPALADTLEALAREGEALFYHGEIANAICSDSEQQGGHLQRSDLFQYEVIMRQPLALNYGDSRLFTNPPPSSGGILIAFALQLLQQLAPTKCHFGSTEHLKLISHAMALTSKARIDAHLDAVENGDNPHPDLMELLDPQFLASYQNEISARSAALRGTTHISIMDRSQNIASMTLSNGEGCGHMVPGCGFMLNNMLGEEDLNPTGFHRWPTNQRMTSMMSPSLLRTTNGASYVLGSGGSNRIRTALLQVIINLVVFKMPLHKAVNAPRLHFENGLLNIEGGFDSVVLKTLSDTFPQQKVWDGHSLFFGGAHSIAFDQHGFQSCGDPRRGGVGVVDE